METNETGNKYFLPIAVVAAGLLIAGAVAWNGSRPDGSADAGTAPVADIKNIKMDGNPFVGDINAPVVIADWSDYQCPFCKNFETQTLPQIMKDYIDAGKVKIVFMDFAFLGSDSIDAGVYGRAIWKLYPDKYPIWRAAMYENQDAENGGFGDATSIDKLNATIPGLDAAKIAVDVEENKAVYQAMIDSDKAEAQKVGINATPSFVIGTEVISGAYPFAKFQSVIDALLK